MDVIDGKEIYTNDELLQKIKEEQKLEEEQDPPIFYNQTTIEKILNSGDKTTRDISVEGVAWVFPREKGIKSTFPTQPNGIEYIGLLFDGTNFLPFYADKTRRIKFGSSEGVVEFGEECINAELSRLRKKRKENLPVTVTGTLSFGDLYKNDYSIKIGEFERITAR